MFFFQILFFLITIFLISLSLVGHGRLITKNLKYNFFIDLFFGFIVISLIVTTFHFFFKIYSLVGILLFLLGLIFFFKSKNQSYLNNLKKVHLSYLIIILLLLPMYISQKYHEDFGYYHLPYALAFLEEKIVFGFANIDNSYVYNSIWLNLNSIFFSTDKNFNFLTLPSFILYLAFIIFLIHNLFKKKISKTSDYYLLVILFYFILKFTRISEFGVDIPAIIFSILSIYYFLKFFDTEDISKKKIIFFFNLAFSIFAILIKFSTAPIIFLSIYLYLKNFKDLRFYIFNKRFIIIYLLFFVFFVQQFIYTGCLFFPTNISCFDVSWFNKDYIDLSRRIELINKSYSLARDIYSPNEYLNNFTWFPYWIKRNYIEILEHFTTILLPVLVFIFFLKKKNNKIFKFQQKKIVYLFILINLVFWLNFSPVYRFGVHIFVTLLFILIIDLLASREFSKKTLTIFVSIFLLFSFSKNISRINKSEDVFIGIQKIDNSFILQENLSNKYVKIYRPDIKNNKKNGWQGRLCWNTPFICSYNKLEVKKKNRYLIINKIHN